MWSSMLLLFHFFFCGGLANSISTPAVKKIGFLPAAKSGEWKKNKRTTFVWQVKEHDTPINPVPSDNDIVSWLKIEAKALPNGTNLETAQSKISTFVKTQSFPLSLVISIQKAFGPSKSAPFTRLLNTFSLDTLNSFIKRSPCAYEKILSLSNYRKLNMNVIFAVINYLQTAPKNDVCTSVNRKRLKEYFLTYNKTVLTKRDIRVIARPQGTDNLYDDIIEILKLPTLFAQTSAVDVEDMALRTVKYGEIDQIFQVISLNLPSQELIPFFTKIHAYNYHQAMKELRAEGKSGVSLSNGPEGAEAKKRNENRMKFITLYNRNWELLESDFIWYSKRINRIYFKKASERWKRLYHRRKTEKKKGMVTLLTLEDDYNSINMGTATPVVTEAFCINAKALPDQTAHFWNLKFVRGIMIKDAILGACPEDESKMEEAINNLRRASLDEEKVECSTVQLLAKQPEFTWFISLRTLKPSVFKRIFDCDFTLDSLLEINEYSFILQQTHQNLARAVKEKVGPIDAIDPSKSPHPSIMNFLTLNKV